MTRTSDLGAPTYVVLFPSTLTWKDGFEALPPAGSQCTVAGTRTHGLSDEVVPTLPLLEWVLHCPRTYHEAVDSSVDVLRRLRGLDLPHNIVLAPYPAIMQPALLEQLRCAGVALVLAPTELAHAASELAQVIGGAAHSATLSELNESLLGTHWRRILRLHGLGAINESRPPSAIIPPSRAPLLLPTMFLEQGIDAGTPRSDSGSSRSEDLRKGLHLQRLITTVARLERRGLSPEDADREVRVEYARSDTDNRFPVVLSLAGVPSGYWKDVDHLAERDGTKGRSPNLSDVENESRAFDFLVTHCAVAKSGLGYNLGQVAASAFEALSTLENMWSATARLRPRKVWSCLRDISEACAPLFTSDALDLISHASRVTLFSHFPLGLAVPPGHSAPMCASTSIAYRPILPLTRAFQFELSRPYSTYLGPTPNVAVVECILPGDPIWDLSQSAWRFMRNSLEALPGASFRQFDVQDLSSLHAALERAASADILVLSAHGVYSPSRNVSGIAVGSQVVIDLDVARLPPLVFLSSCQVSPRGRASVNIADLLFRSHTQAVIAPLIPISVTHNAMLMARFCAYLSEWGQPAASGEDRSVADVWHHVLASNAVNDVLSASKWLTTWAASTDVVSEFMLQRSPGRIRLTHLYDDTVKVLTEMAAERGVDARLSQTLRTSGFVPESLFYLMLGRPEKLMVRSSLLHAVSAERDDPPKHQGRPSAGTL